MSAPKNPAAEARDCWAETGLNVTDLTYAEVMRLRDLIDDQCRLSGVMDGTLRACAEIKRNTGGSFIQCSAYYFSRREAVSLETHGWVGFAGWADDENRPIFTRAFNLWLVELCKARGLYLPAGLATTQEPCPAI